MAAIGSDHAGFALKEQVKAYLLEKRFEVFDMGCHSKESVDYPDFAKRVCREVLQRECTGILVCGTGIGMSIAANKIQGIRAAHCTTEFEVAMSRQHNCANVLFLGARVLRANLPFRLVEVFLQTPFEGGRHLRRVNKIMALET